MVLEIWNPQGSELIKSVELKPRRDEIRTTEVPAGVRWWFENPWDGDSEPQRFRPAGGGGWRTSRMEIQNHRGSGRHEVVV